MHAQKIEQKKKKKKKKHTKKELKIKMNKNNNSDMYIITNKYDSYQSRKKSNPTQHKKYCNKHLQSKFSFIQY